MRKKLTTAAVALAILAGCGEAKTSDGQPLGCNSLRDTLVAAKDASNKNPSDVTRAEVEASAKAARANGCNIDDLVGPNVGKG